MKKISILLLLFTLFNVSAQEPSLLEKIQGADKSEFNKLIGEMTGSKDAKRDLYLGILYHNRANISGTLSDINQGLKLLDNYYKKTKDPLALGYYGSLLTIEGSYYEKKEDLIKATQGVDNGTKAMDKAVTKAPKLIDLRFLRMINSVNVSDSSPFKRYKQARSDAEFIKTKYATLSNSSKALYHYYYGKVLLNEKKSAAAMSEFEQSIKIDPTGESAVLAKKALMLLEE